MNYSRVQALHHSINTMKTLSIIGIFFFLSTISYGQDGSDIRYYKIQEIDSSFVGLVAQIDFYRRSFGGFVVDTITLNIDNRQVKFIERRKDDGYNNWFYEQYLQSADSISRESIRITQFRIERITNDAILTKMFMEYYDVNKKLIPKKSRQQAYWFKKSTIEEILIRTTRM